MNILETIMGRGLPAGRVLRAWFIVWLGVSWMLFHLYAGFYGAPNAMLFRTLHLGVAMALVFLYLPLRRRDGSQPPFLIALDTVFILGSLWASAYFMIHYDTWEFRRADMQVLDYATGVMVVFLTLEATRRAVGLALPLICLFFIFHALFSNIFPAPFNTAPASMERVVRTLFLGDEGIFGVAVAVMSQFVVLFILFGTLLTMTGGGAFFTRLAFALFGHRTGGPAKAAVVSSGLLGMLSGSAISNVVTTGTFTIPLMRRLGYRGAFAGGVEAAASNGGPLVPPVMGAVAFIMAEFMNRKYADIALAAAIPALLYFFVIFITVHFEAKKLGLRAMDRAMLPRALDILRRQGYLLLPLVLIVITLILGYSIVFVAIIVIGTTFVMALLQRAHRMTPYRLLDSLESTVRSVVGLCATGGAAGIIIGAVFATGLTYTVAQFVVDSSGGQLWIILLLAALLSLIMGMGMPAVAIYITLVATVIPILIKAGISPMAAHMFAFYFGNAAAITPPVAIAAYAAAPIAKAGPMETGWQATRLGAATFLLPFLFVYGPGLLLEGPWYGTVQVTFTSALGLTAIALALTGYFMTVMPVWQRLVLLASALFLIVPELITDAIGVVLFGVGAGANWLTARRDGVRTLAAVTTERAVPATAPTRLGRAWDRFLAARLEKEAEGAPLNAAAVNVDDPAALIMSEPEGPGGPREVSTRALWLSWLAVGGAALAMEYMGNTFFHARHPLVWVAAVGTIAALGVFAVARIWATGRERPVAAVAA